MADRVQSVGRGPAARAWARFRQHRFGLAGLVTLALLAALCFSAGWIAEALGSDPEAVDLFGQYAPPTVQHPLGKDSLGRDVLMRLLHGGQVSLTVALTAALAATVIGTAIGLMAGYVGGWLDSLLMRLVDSVIALPLLPLLIVMAAVDPAKVGLGAFAEEESFGLIRIIVIVALVGWTTPARLVRGATLAARAQGYVRAARALGVPPSAIALRHILPNVSGPLIVATTLAMGQVILFESALSFLGLGIQPPTPSWGNMLTGAQELIWQAPMLAVYPGLAIFLTVVSVNFVGDALQDALATRSTERERG
ncbi:MAG TPA: ABC transporter permease [Alphaproteobacteria bacterium]|nr:ABC transporter permease [Alphaproteobacteria bacterium]